MRCQICNKEDNEVYDSFYNGRVITACRSCITIEGLSIIKKPTFEQLDRANQRASVHDRMMKLAGLDKLSPVSKDHEVAQRNIAKIKIPPKKQYSDVLVYNYDWAIMMARRRKKMTITQLADLTHIPQIDLEDMEKGVLPKNFERNAKIISSVLNIPLLKEQEERLKARPPVKTEINKTEEEILMETREKLFGKDLEINHKNEELRRLSEESEEQSQIDEEEAEEEEQKEEIRREVSSGKFDFSKTEKLKNVTLNDLINMKKEREKRDQMEKEFQEKRENSKKDYEED